MEWLAQHWTWILVLVGALWLLARYGRGARSPGQGSAHRIHRDDVATGTDPAAANREAGEPRAARAGASVHRHRGGCC